MLSTKELTPQILVNDFGFSYEKSYNQYNINTCLIKLQAQISKDIDLSYLIGNKLLVAYNSLEYVLNESFSIDTTPQIIDLCEPQIIAEPTQTKPTNENDFFVSYFTENIYVSNSKPTINLSFAALIELIRSEKFRDVITKLRSYEYKSKQYDNLKNKLNYFCPSGVFSVRNNESFEILAPIICLDLDFSDNKDVNLDTLKVNLRLNKNVLAFFLSPSGKGLKVFIKALFDSNSFFDVSKQVREYFEFEYNITLDKAQNKLSQPCFVSFDKTAYYNESAILFSGFVAPALLPKQAKEIQKTEIESIDSIEFSNSFEFIEKLLAKQNKAFFDGAKHSYLYEFACLANKIGIDYNELTTYVASKYIALDKIKSNCLTYPYAKYKDKFHTFKLYEKNRNKVIKSKKSIKEFKPQDNVYFPVMQNCIQNRDFQIAETTMENYEYGVLTDKIITPTFQNCYYKTPKGLQIVTEIVEKSNSNLVQKIWNFIVSNLKQNTNLINLKREFLEKHYNTKFEIGRYNSALVFLIENNVIKKHEFEGCYAVNYNFYFNGSSKSLDKFIRKLYKELVKK